MVERLTPTCREVLEHGKAAHLSTTTKEGQVFVERDFKKLNGKWIGVDSKKENDVFVLNQKRVRVEFQVAKLLKSYERNRKNETEEKIDQQINFPTQLAKIVSPLSKKTSKNILLIM